eukprot:maker-scaffold620_size123222-snap-gene-0.13 protein:Tk05598 transcript:maker-scaffold620_size123222-snap-gene-0.13-mRNA-1 annotation:"atp-sensitive inward rectifier potassium channel 12"
MTSGDVRPRSRGAESHPLSERSSSPSPQRTSSASTFSTSLRQCDLAADKPRLKRTSLRKELMMSYRHQYRTMEPTEHMSDTCVEPLAPLKGNNFSSDEEDDDLSSDENSSLLAEEAKQVCYITVQNKQGQLEQIQVEVDDQQFTTSIPLLNYLKDQGELDAVSFSGSEATIESSPRKSINSLFRKRLISGSNASPASGESGLMAEATDLEAALTGHNSCRVRADSIITNDLMNKLKEDRKRIIAKGGQCNVVLKKVSKKRRKFILDLFTTAVDMQWRWTLMLFATSFFVSWFIFGAIYWIIAWGHGDFEPDHLPKGVGQTSGNFTPCVWAINNFASCFLFSVETQHTIGYGSRQTTEECSIAIIVMCLQSVIGVIISACMAGIVFAKLARPKGRSHTVMFSKNAVISQRDGALYLFFRVGNMRKSHLIEAHVRAQLIHYRRITQEGVAVQFEHTELQVSSQLDWMEDRALLHWPITFCHKIDKESPLYTLGPKDLLSARFEMIVSLEGIVEPTGNSVQARSSYLPNEILWGYHFENMVNYSKRRGVYLIDCSNLNAVVENNTPRLARKKWDALKAARERAHSVPDRELKALPKSSVLIGEKVQGVKEDPNVIACLSCPAMKSVDCERIFSTFKDLLSSQKNLLTERHLKDQLLI